MVYLILAANIYKNPKKYSGPWNFGTEKNAVTSVLTIVKYAIKNWGHGKLFIKKQKNIMSKQIYNLILRKKILKWKPKYKIQQSVKLTLIGIRKFWQRNLQRKLQEIKLTAIPNKL